MILQSTDSAPLTECKGINGDKKPNLETRKMSIFRRIILPKRVRNIQVKPADPVSFSENLQTDMAAHSSLRVLQIQTNQNPFPLTNFSYSKCV
jgi:hypothetical protein